MYTDYPWTSSYMHLSKQFISELTEHSNRLLASDNEPHAADIKFVHGAAKSRKNDHLPPYFVPLRTGRRPSIKGAIKMQSVQ